VRTAAKTVMAPAKVFDGGVKQVPYHETQPKTEVLRPARVA